MPGLTQDRHGQHELTSLPQSDLSLRPKTPPSRTFITFTGNLVPDAKARTLIRKQAMQQVGKDRRKFGLVRRQPAFQFELDIPQHSGGVPYFAAQELLARDVGENTWRDMDPDEVFPLDPIELQSTDRASSQDSETSAEDDGPVPALQQQLEVSSRLQNPGQFFDRLGAGRLDPFFHYPFQLDHYSKSLVDTLFDDRYKHFQVFRRSWFPVACMDTSAFYHCLSISALHRSMLDVPNAEFETQQSLKHHASALRSLNSKITNKQLAMSDGVVIGILGFCCHYHSVGGYNLWRTHAAGLREIISLRGGIDAIKNPEIRVVIAWVDVTGSTTQDCPASFDLPTELLSTASDPRQFITRPPLSVRISRAWRTAFPHRTTLISIFDDLSRLTQDIIASAARTDGSIYNDDDFAAYQIIPFLHRLLDSSVRPDIDDYNNDIGGSMQEAVRLACVLFLVEVRRTFGVGPIITTVQVAKLRALLQEESPERDWEMEGIGLGWLKVWVLAMGVLEGDCGERVWFQERLEVSMRQIGVATAGQVAEKLRGLLWMDDIHGVKFIGIQHATAELLRGQALKARHVDCRHDGVKIPPYILQALDCGIEVHRLPHSQLIDRPSWEC